MASTGPRSQERAAWQKQAEALGMFTHDRELLRCDGCGLMEDVSHTGMLITCRDPDLGTDTGLRFVKEAEGSFRCPSCHQTVQEMLPDGAEDRLDR